MKYRIPTTQYWQLFLLGATLLMPLTAAAQFTNATNTAMAGAIPVHSPPAGVEMRIGTGAAWFDFDNDGDLDLYMTRRNGANRLYSNDGDGTFTEVAATFGVEDASHDGAGVAVADYDNDGDLDMYLANSDEDVFFENQLIETGTANFTDVTATALAGNTMDERGTSVSWGDYDGDGLLDLYVANHLHMTEMANGFPVADEESSQDYLFRNNGDGTFTDASALLLGGDGPDDNGRDDNLGGFGFIAGWTDFDSDGDMDLYLMNDCPLGPEGNKLFRNDGGTNATSAWTFTEVASTIGADQCQNAMGLATGDYDRDLDMDYFFSNIGSATLLENDMRTVTFDGSPQFASEQFDDETTPAGLFDATHPTTGENRKTWGTIFFDYDNDGFLDLVLAAGTMTDPASDDPQPTLLYNNDGDGTFTDVTAGSGVQDANRTRTIVMGDYDEDGKPDLFMVNYDGTARLARNTDANTNSWLQVELVGTESNRNGIGAKIFAETPDGVTQAWEVRSGTSLGGGDDLAAYFGLGVNVLVSEIRIEWPSGLVQTLADVAVDQRLVVTETVPAPYTNTTTSLGGIPNHTVPEEMRIGTGAAWFDFDNDDDLDLYMTRRAGANRLFRNDGDGTFTEVATTFGAGDATHDGAGVAVADYDNDGDLDLYLANSDEDVLLENQLIPTGTANFTDVTATALGGLTLPERGTSASWGDYNNDGFLDLYVANHLHMTEMANGFPAADEESNQDYLLLNDGDGTFTDVSALMLGGDGPDDNGRDDNLGGFGFLGGWTDFDNDGDLDLYLMNDCPLGPEGNKLFRNDGGTNATSAWTFTEVASTIGADQCQNAMGLATGDYDRDLDMDYYFSDIGSATLLQNDFTDVTLSAATGTFIDQTVAAGVFDETSPNSGENRISWGAVFYDYNNDGWLDLAVATGTLSPTSAEDEQPNILYLSDGDGTFTDVSTGSGINDVQRTRTIVMGDYDEDGAADLFMVNYGEQSRLVRNTTSLNHRWLQVELEGVQSNKNGIGAKIFVTTPDNVTQAWEVRSGTSLGGGDDLAAYFGLGNNLKVSEIRVQWPSGITQTMTNQQANQRMTITEDGALPVELANFTALVDGETAWLQWWTASEENNLGFEVQRRTGALSFEPLAFIDGAGTTTERRSYAFRTDVLEPGTHTFRLKQIDVDGHVSYSPLVEVTVALPDAYHLSPVYPNPFNPQATFTLALQQQQDVQITLYDVLGRHVRTLYQGALAGDQTHTFQLNGNGLASGVYLLRATGEAFTATQQVTLLK